MVKAKINKSYFYKDSEREEIFFYIEGSKKGKFCLGNGQDVYGRPRDYCNFINDISVINHDAMMAAENFDATLYSSSKDANEKINEYIASSSYNYNEAKLKKDLEEFILNSEKKDDAWHFQYCLRDIKNSSTNGLKHLSPEVQANCLNFVRDVIEENIEPTGRKIKSINDRRSFLDKIRGKNKVTGFYFSNLEHSISVLSDTKYIEEIKDLYKDGFPEVVKIEEAKEKGEIEIKELGKNFDSKKEASVRGELFKQYGAERIRGAMQLKYYEETNDLSIFLSPKEQEEFNSMTLKDLKEKYGTDLITTHKGAALLTRKIHEEKAKGTDIRSDLVELKELANNAKTAPNNDMAIRRYIFDELRKDYQKFATDDMEYRGVVEELAPTKTEKAYINYYLSEKEKANEYINDDMAVRLAEIKEFQTRFIKDSDFIITGKASKSDIEETKARIVGKKKEETVKQAIKRVKEKHAEDRKTGENISGAVIADDIAERLKDGFELPTSKEKREAIATNLRKKRAMKEK